MGSSSMSSKSTSVIHGQGDSGIGMSKSRKQIKNKNTRKNGKITTGIKMLRRNAGVVCISQCNSASLSHHLTMSSFPTIAHTNIKTNVTANANNSSISIFHNDKHPNPELWELKQKKIQKQDGNDLKDTENATTVVITTTASDCFSSAPRSLENNNNRNSYNNNNGHDQREHHHNHHHHQANNGRHHHPNDDHVDNFLNRHPQTSSSLTTSTLPVNAMGMTAPKTPTATLTQLGSAHGTDGTHVNFDVDKENAGKTREIMQLSSHRQRQRHRQSQLKVHRQLQKPRPYGHAENGHLTAKACMKQKKSARSPSLSVSLKNKNESQCKDDTATREEGDESDGNNKSGKNKNNNNNSNHQKHPPHHHQHQQPPTPTTSPVSSCFYSSSTRSSRSSSSSYKWSRIMLLAVCQMASVLSQALNPGPKFGEPIPNVTVAVGRDASLPCVVENLGNHKVAWVHIDRRMILTIHKHIVTRIPRFSVSYDSHKTWLLHVNSVQQEDRGYYMCQVNTEPMISQVGYLQVVVPPNICDDDSSESHVAVREQLNITLSCKAEGFPEPRITWKREDGQPFAVDRRRKVNSSDGERLQLYRISRLEMGAYLCIASNGVPPSVSKRIIVDVEFSPMIWVPNQLVGAPSGTNVTLECNTEAFPRAISYWVYDDMMILTTGKYNTESIESSYRTHMRLTIRNLRDKDFGRYRCLSKNSLGEAEGAIRLYEIPQPSLAPKATEVRHGNPDSPVNVVRLTPIPKTDDKRTKWTVENHGKKNKEAQQGRGVGGSNGNHIAISNGDNSIQVPSIGGDSANSKGSSSVRHFSVESYLMVTAAAAASFVVSGATSLLSWNWNLNLDL